MAGKTAVIKGQVRQLDGRGQWIPDPSWPLERSAPESLEIVRRFVNTINLHSGADLLGSVAELNSWFCSEGYASQLRMNTDERLVVIELRRILRALTLCNSDGGSSRALWAELTSLAARFPVHMSFETASGRLFPATSEISTYVVNLLQAVFFARADGTWGSLKACSDDTCRWVVFDQTKNQSVEWCSAGTCGGKARAKAYRARKRS